MTKKQKLSLFDAIHDIHKSIREVILGSENGPDNSFKGITDSKVFDIKIPTPGEQINNAASKTIKVFVDSVEEVEAKNPGIIKEHTRDK